MTHEGTLEQLREATGQEHLVDMFLKLLDTKAVDV
jgi:hypothetical protein